MITLAQKFLEQNDIDLKLGYQRLYETADINEILERYMVSLNIGWQNVCIKDILGYDYGWRGEPSDLYQSFTSYFDSEGDTYHSRANSMLNYSSSEMVEKLSQSFKDEPISLLEVEKGKYVVETNGIHRFNILKVCYFGEIKKCRSQEEIDAVNKKFTIPVQVSKIDIFKSYCNYLLNRFQSDNVWFSIDKSNSKLSILSYEMKKITLNNHELLQHISDNIKPEIIEESEINYFCQKYPSFKEFLSLYIEKTKEGKKI